MFAENRASFVWEKGWTASESTGLEPNEPAVLVGAMAILSGKLEVEVLVNTIVASV